MNGMRNEQEHAAWLADKIVAGGDYAKEAAQMLRRWPSRPSMTEQPVALSTLTDERIHPRRQFSMIGKLGEKLARLLDEDQWAECEAMLLAIEHGPWQNLAPAASMDEYSSECLECGGTGMRDSGGFQPWGEAVSIPCDCGGIQAMADRIRSERAVAALAASAPAQQAGQSDEQKLSIETLRRIRATLTSGMERAAMGAAILTLSESAKCPESLLMEADAVDALLDDGWIWDGDQWQRALASNPLQPVAAEVVTESVAKAIYQQWKELLGFRPWEERGNSLMQDKARDLARAALSGTGSDESNA